MLGVKSAILVQATSLRFSFENSGFITYSNGISSGGRVVRNRYYDIYNGDSTSPDFSCICVIEINAEDGRTKFCIRDLGQNEKVIFDNRSGGLRFKEVSEPNVPVFTPGEEIRFDQGLTNPDLANQSLSRLVPSKLYLAKQPKRGIDGSFMFLSGRIYNNRVSLSFIDLRIDSVNGDIKLIAQAG